MKDGRGGKVIVYDGIHEPFIFKSHRMCAEAYGISRKKLQELIDTGATHSDGRTTFDEVIENEKFF